MFLLVQPDDLPLLLQIRLVGLGGPARVHGHDVVRVARIGDVAERTVLVQPVGLGFFPSFGHATASTQSSLRSPPGPPARPRLARCRDCVGSPRVPVAGTGVGFRYVDDAGSPLDAEQVTQCRQLVIPPAWEDVWICPDPYGHLQAIGTDSEGRKQYLYHPEWRRRQDAAKFDRVLDLAERLPRARRRVIHDLEADELTRTRSLAAAFRLLDRGLFRVGTQSYKEQN